jgi:hypothetical protein
MHDLGKRQGLHHFLVFNTATRHFHQNWDEPKPHTSSRPQAYALFFTTQSNSNYDHIPCTPPVTSPESSDHSPPAPEPSLRATRCSGSSFVSETVCVPADPARPQASLSFPCANTASSAACVSPRPSPRFAWKLYDQSTASMAPTRTPARTTTSTSSTCAPLKTLSNLSTPRYQHPHRSARIHPLFSIRVPNIHNNLTTPGPSPTRSSSTSLLQMPPRPASPSSPRPSSARPTAPPRCSRPRPSSSASPITPATHRPSQPS